MGSNAELAAVLGLMVQTERKVAFIGQTTRASVFLKAKEFSLPSVGVKAYVW